MTFPRNPDNSLNFNAFLLLDKPTQVLAFNDLKTNGTPEERKQFQNFRSKMMELQKTKKEIDKLDAEITEHRKEISFKIKAFTSKITLPATSDSPVESLTSSFKAASLKTT